MTEEIIRFLREQNTERAKEIIALKSELGKLRYEFIIFKDENKKERSKQNEN